MKNKRNSFIVFLDIDGVLNTRATVETTPEGNIGIDYARVSILAKAMKKFGCGDIVLTSDWKDMKPDRRDYIYLVSKLAEYKLEISDKIKGVKSERGAGVMAYLAEHPEIDEFVILDDNTFDFRRYNNLWERLLLTNGIENAEYASKTPAIETILFLGDIKSSS